MKLKNNQYYSREDFKRHVCTITLGRYLYDGSTSVSFLEIAAYLGVSADSLRMRKKDAKTMQMLADKGITVTKIKGINHFQLENNELYVESEEVDPDDVTEDGTLIV